MDFLFERGGFFCTYRTPWLRACILIVSFTCIHTKYGKLRFCICNNCFSSMLVIKTCVVCILGQYTPLQAYTIYGYSYINTLNRTTDVIPLITAPYGFIRPHPMTLELFSLTKGIYICCHMITTLSTTATDIKKPYR